MRFNLDDNSIQRNDPFLGISTPSNDSLISNATVTQSNDASVTSSDLVSDIPTSTHTEETACLQQKNRSSTKSKSSVLLQEDQLTVMIECEWHIMITFLNMGIFILHFYIFFRSIFSISI